MATTLTDAEKRALTRFLKEFGDKANHYVPEIDLGKVLQDLQSLTVDSRSFSRIFSRQFGVQDITLRSKDTGALGRRVEIPGLNLSIDSVAARGEALMGAGESLTIDISPSAGGTTVLASPMVLDNSHDGAARNVIAPTGRQAQSFYASAVYVAGGAPVAPDVTLEAYWSGYPQLVVPGSTFPLVGIVQKAGTLASIWVMSPSVTPAAGESFSFDFLVTHADGSQDLLSSGVPTTLVSVADGACANTDTLTGHVTSATAGFITAGVKPGDIITLSGGLNTGSYVILSVDSATQVTIQTEQSNALQVEATVPFTITRDACVLNMSTLVNQKVVAGLDVGFVYGSYKLVPGDRIQLGNATYKAGRAAPTMGDIVIGVDITE